MTKQKRILSVMIASLLMLLLILDADTAKNAAISAIELCMGVVIPSLFPFFVITTYLNNNLLGLSIPGAKRIGKLLSIPSGCESLLVVGLIGGYPVGAQLVADACRENLLSKNTGKILLGYCSNAGPAFIFGVAGVLFSSIHITLALWIIHLVSALLNGYLLPRPKELLSVNTNIKVCTIAKALQKSISICAFVCGWIVIFKIGITFLDQINLSVCNPVISTVIKGLFELSNGCILLYEIQNEAIRFLIVSGLLAFGGICVLLQTVSVTENIGLGLYLPGKIMQTCISLILSTIVLPFLFPDIKTDFHTRRCILLCSFILILPLQAYCKKRCGNPENNHV